jgi:hypothetical protein
MGDERTKTYRLSTLKIFPQVKVHKVEARRPLALSAWAEIQPYSADTLGLRRIPPARLAGCGAQLPVDFNKTLANVLFNAL